METKFSFCESTYASGRSLWHLRILTEKGLKFSGGTDTLSLCGLTMGWDLDVTITKHHLSNNCCSKCAEKYETQSRES
jgi:hypothetical protein